MGKYANVLEPEWFIEAFEACPPVGFDVRANSGLRFFVVKFDLLTTLEAGVKRWLRHFSFLLPKPKTIFIGQTNTEYAPVPATEPASGIGAAALSQFSAERASAVIFKDLPTESPLLSERDNRSAADLKAHLREKGFEIVSGEALAFVPIDFRTEAEFLSRFSGNRRHQLKKKLRVRSRVKLTELVVGRDSIGEDRILEIYALFEQVYNQSEIQFDKLSLEFFRRILLHGGPEGRLFLYEVDGRLLSFVYGLVFEGKFIYKYIGFDYSRSREFNLYYVSWFHMLDYCLRENLTHMIAGWTDPQIKAYLGSTFTYTEHAVYFRSRTLRFCLRAFKRFFESDKAVLGDLKK